MRSTVPAAVESLLDHPVCICIYTYIFLGEPVDFWSVWKREKERERNVVYMTTSYIPICRLRLTCRRHLRERSKSVRTPISMMLTIKESDTSLLRYYTRVYDNVMRSDGTCAFPYEENKRSLLFSRGFYDQLKCQITFQANFKPDN